jgi:transposase-like protein
MKLTNAKREQAAQLIAEGRYEQAEIAETVGVERMSLYRWRKDPKFGARVDEFRRELNEAALKRAVARRQYRVNTLANRHSELLTVIEERAADPDLAKIPGGSTGLMVKTYKVSGETVMAEYAVDTAMLRELRGIEEAVAKELGQLVEKREHVVRGLKDLSDEELAALIAETETAP